LRAAGYAGPISKAALKRESCRFVPSAAELSTAMGVS
jgi:hypothetical protein